MQRKKREHETPKKTTKEKGHNDLKSYWHFLQDGKLHSVDYLPNVYIAGACWRSAEHWMLIWIIDCGLWQLRTINDLREGEREISTSMKKKPEELARRRRALLPLSLRRPSRLEIFLIVYHHLVSFTLLLLRLRTTNECREGKTRDDPSFSFFCFFFMPRIIHS